MILCRFKFCNGLTNYAPGGPSHAILRDEQHCPCMCKRKLPWSDHPMLFQGKPTQYSQLPYNLGRKTHYPMKN